MREDRGPSRGSPMGTTMSAMVHRGGKSPSVNMERSRGQCGAEALQSSAPLLALAWWQASSCDMPFTRPYSSFARHRATCPYVRFVCHEEEDARWSPCLLVLLASTTTREGAHMMEATLRLQLEAKAVNTDNNVNWTTSCDYGGESRQPADEAITTEA